jgi:hypothetical protein
LRDYQGKVNKTEKSARFWINGRQIRQKNQAHRLRLDRAAHEAGVMQPISTQAEIAHLPNLGCL